MARIRDDIVCKLADEENCEINCELGVTGHYKVNTKTNVAFAKKVPVCKIGISDDSQ